MNYKDTIVKSLKEFLDWLDDSTIFEVSSDIGNKIEFENTSVYYRGQSDCKKKLLPGIFREPLSPGIIEHELIQKATLRLWRELYKYTTYLEKVVFLQHYGMPTRLLDITFNPLVALYFACSNEEQNGAVFCGFQQDNRNDFVAELTSEFINKSHFDYFDNELKDFVKMKNVPLKIFTQPIFVLPPINNPRIEHQSGSFIMSPIAKINNDMMYINKQSLDDSGYFSEKRAIIPNNCKSSILIDLHKFGINKGNIYQGISEKIESIVQEEKWEIMRYKISLEEK